ncbi:MULTISPECIES: exodeoxyribonuclease VII small subunit [unclassified Moraxella]|uniref:exodeoxyribonuclease VII small subunit n=1 Tax=unclassified Moraxella TaxID=2685852 RepID=UPI003AF856CD
MTQPQDFKTAYDILQKNAQTLQNSQEPNIDELMNIVEESINAYKVCQNRIDAVEQALNQAFETQ